MADFNLIKISNVWLTDDGLETGLPCRTEVGNLGLLQLDKAGNVRLAADGTPYPYTLDNTGKGVSVQIRVPVIMKEVLDDIRSAINAALAGNTTVNVVVEGDLGDFDLDCYPSFPSAVDAPGSFSDEHIDNVSFNFIVAEVN